MRLTAIITYCRPDPRLKRHLFYLLLTFCQLACQKERPPGATQVDAFFPLILGTTWSYEIVDEVRNTTTTFTDKVERTQFTANGGPLKADNGNATRASYETVVSETSGSDGQLLVLYKSSSQYIGRSLSFGRLEDGSSDYQIISTELKFLPRLLKPGVHWSNTTVPFGSMSSDLKIVQTHVVYAEDDVVTVPAGRFSNCIRIVTSAVFMSDSSDSGRERRYLEYVDWYAPNVGLIKTSLSRTGFFGGEIAKVELIQFRQGSFTGVPPPPSTEQRTVSHPSLMD
jgi:hypothetical protein